MPSTYSCLHYHVVFATHQRAPLLDRTWRERLHEYLGGSIRGVEGVPLAVGGVADHVHILMGLRPTHCLADFMRELKKSATQWIIQVPKVREFRWQEGYSAFAVSASMLPRVRAYIVGQESHHQKEDSRSELLKLLGRSGVVVDAKYFE